MSNKEWQINSWRNCVIKQQPLYPDQKSLKQTEAKLKNMPSLVFFDEIDNLKMELKNVCERKSFLLQGGDCAESFLEFNEENLQEYFKVMLQMTMTLMYVSGKSVVKVGRIAGQFAKPRSSDTEIINGQTYPSYRGDMVNSILLDKKARIPNPENMIKVYKQSGVTLNYLRALASGGFASIDNIYSWLHNFAGNDRKLAKTISEIKKSVDFFNACGFNLSSQEDYKKATFFSSHEALLLNYEESLIRKNPKNNKFYNCSAHMLWIGERTRNLTEAHIEFFRGIYNPIATKVGPTMEPEELIKLIKILNPDNEKGRLTLIVRMGAKIIKNKLPRLITAVQEKNLNVIWSCDPMHGNTETSSNNYKTRRFDNIIKEVECFFNIHKKQDSYAGGIHIEMTGQNVTECLGGKQKINEEDLKNRYKTHCDPRLNSSQSIELAFLIAEMID